MQGAVNNFLQRHRRAAGAVLVGLIYAFQALKWQKALDFLHRHKRIAGAVLVGFAYAFKALDWHAAADAVLTVGTLAGVGVLPNGPNPKR